MEKDKYTNKNGKIVNVPGTWFNEYNLMTINSLSEYQKHLEQLEQDKTRLLKIIKSEGDFF